jgi:hypothetical protein
MTPGERERAMGTHGLESAQGGTSQDNERQKMSEGHSHTEEWAWRDKQDSERERASEMYSRPVERRARDKSGYQQKAGEEHSLAEEHACEGEVRTPKGSERARDTHRLESTRTSRDIEGKRVSDGALTSWRAQTV